MSDAPKPGQSEGPRAPKSERYDDRTPPPELPRAPRAAPNYVTQRGLAMLQERVAQAKQKVEAAGLTELERAWARRELSWLQTRLGSALLVSRSPRDEVGFGAIVEVSSEGRTRIWQIVGDDEADTKRGLVSWNSPLARALLGARVGDTVSWRKPSGDSQIVVLHIEYNL